MRKKPQCCDSFKWSTQRDFFFNIQGCKYEDNIKICMIGKIKSCDEKVENFSLKLALKTDV